jgi:hypothetical protein
MKSESKGKLKFQELKSDQSVFGKKHSMKIMTSPINQNTVAPSVEINSSMHMISSHFVNSTTSTSKTVKGGAAFVKALKSRNENGLLEAQTTGKLFKKESTDN